MRYGRESLFQLRSCGRTARVVENGDAGKFRNNFFEQLEPLPT
jgi:hypothetical protein